LKDWSPAIGAGTVSGAPTTDIDGNPRPNPAGSNPDMGAYENPLADPAPGPFELFSPFKGETVEINRHNYTDTLFFTWTEAIDASGDDVTYDFEFTGDLGVLYWHFFDHCDETEFMCKVPNHRIEDFLSIEGVEVVSGTWSVIATDGKGYSYPTNGPFELTIDASSVSVDEPMLIPETFSLHANYPNPFNPSTAITYDLPKRSLVTLGIYDILGKQIKTLVNQSQDAGNKIAVWDGTDDLGRQVSAGVYLYQIQAGEFTQTRKMLLLK
ncbi:MAG: T9SS type A sorting domain-containing protein, partial [Candidatus Marinimicrobia bacterium]|nr:T9SS type A sorting domain-containing protein [Candidatus Neomarinimicrobiota bacterium]